MKIRDMLTLSADSEKMGGTNDTLSFQVNRTRQKYYNGHLTALADEELAQVAGGFGPLASSGGGPCSCGSYNVVSTSTKWKCLDCGKTWDRT